MTRALIVWGGWDGHEPDQVADLFKGILTDAGVAGSPDFEVTSELYYLHVDPANSVMATTRTDAVTWYHSPNGPVDMPVVWTRQWGLGRVYYNALGHKADVISDGPAYEMLRRGLLWAADSKSAAKGRDLASMQSPGNHC